MLKLYDFRCSQCGREREEFFDVQSGDVAPSSGPLFCDRCDDVVSHDRLVSPPAQYLGDRPRNPCVTGGSFDTMGYSPVQALPDLPPGADSTLENYRQLWAGSDWQEKRALQREQNRKNRLKRKRAEALARGGTVNMRVDRCEGDPKMDG